MRVESLRVDHLELARFYQGIKISASVYEALAREASPR